ncbi:IS110 family transposase [Mesorhizobium sp. NZP2298]|uniref:IS110 family transposase n=1 Tax=Mesorhizobium sp. NZP2298 TaxID=2483403 RepID=UPI001553703E|nr:IS110 family transposase [Mesorhizobium sp. NZP2298]QKC98881.1 IS110 family transposase [Mesorhizobium sp. NZP2298]
MSELATVGIDLAKTIFQIHGVDESGRVLVRCQLRRSQLLAFFQKRPRCLIGMEACAGSHDWGRKLQGMGHDVRLMPPSYVKPYVKRGKTDAADAAAICEAVTRPSMRFVSIKSVACSSVLVLHRTRDFLVRQRTQIGNAIRAHMTEFGVITAKGAQNVGRLREQLDRLPQAARLPITLLFEQLAETNERIERLTEGIKETHAQSETSQRLATIPGVGMLSATIIAATTPDVDNFGSARDYAAWLGLTPKPHSTGGKQRVGRISKMGNRYIRRLLYLGAMAQIMLRCRLKREPSSDWLSGMLMRKKTKIVAVALAHRMARTIFAVLRDGSRYEPQSA